MFYAQSLMDDFSDGDFTNNPVWNGDALLYTVNGSLELQTNDLGNANTSYLSTPIIVADSVRWECSIRLDFAPSTSNYTRLVLIADNNDLTLAQNGFYVQIGSSGSLDSIEIYRLDSGTPTKVFGGTAGQVATNPNVSIRIDRDNQAVWNVYADYTGGTNYQFEGTFTDVSHSQGVAFGFVSTYTTTRGDKFFFDNILVSPLQTDTTAPELIGATAINANQISLQFNESLSSASASNLTHFSISPPSTITNAQLSATDNQIIELTTTVLNSGTNWVYVQGVEDLNSNAMALDSASFNYIQAQTAVRGDILINEIHADPTPIVGLPDAEYVELLNVSTKSIDLANFIFNDGVDRIVPTFILEPDSLVILASSANSTLLSSYGTVLDIGSLSLLNGGETLILQNDQGDVIDSLAYDLSWYDDVAKSGGGWSLELVNPNLICQGAQNWRASVDPLGGTPGIENSVFSDLLDTLGPQIVQITYVGTSTLIVQFDDVLAANATTLSYYQLQPNIPIQAITFLDPNTIQIDLNSAMANNTQYTLLVSLVEDCTGNAVSTNLGNNTFVYIEISIADKYDIVINEIMCDPSPIVGLPEVEYIELYNRSNKAFDLSGFTFDDGSVRTLPNFILLPQAYVLLVPDANVSSFTSIADVVGLTNISLNNGGEYLVLKNSFGTTIDAVNYSDDWYQNASKDDGGWSLELIDPNQVCEDEGNWIASEYIWGGTPGFENSVFVDERDTVSPQITDVIQLSDDSIYIVFNEYVDSSTLVGSTITVGTLTTQQIIFESSSRIILILNGSLASNTTYTILFSTVMDCIGNMGSASSSFLYKDVDQASAYDVIINEIMNDPSPTVGLPEVEYIEFYNRSDKLINLGGAMIEDESGQIAFLPNYLLGPDQYLLVSSTSIAPFNGFTNFLQLSGLPSLNSEDLVVLKRNDGYIIDAVDYKTSWYQDTDKDNGGWSLERISSEWPCQGFENWRASMDITGGTPGRENAQISSDQDVVSPSVVRAYPLSADSIILYFSEAMDRGITTNDLSIDQGLNITGVYPVAPIFDSYTIRLDGSMLPGRTYTITLQTSAFDCYGNAIGIDNTVRVGLPNEIQSGDLVINEILFNPNTGGSDFVELYNLSDRILDAQSLIFSNLQQSEEDPFMFSGGTSVRCESSFLIFPGDYIVITKDKISTVSTYETEAPSQVIEQSLPSLPDDEGQFFLYASYDSTYIDSLGITQQGVFGKLIDYFEYEDDMHVPMIDDDNGVSLERIQFSSPTNDKNNWHSASSTVGYSTPTYLNSASRTSGTDQMDILSLDTEVFSPDDDGFEDFLLIQVNFEELGNVVDIRIFDAQGNFIRQLVNGDLFSTDQVIKWDGSDETGNKCRVGAYVILLNAFTSDGNRVTDKATCVVASKF